MSNASTGITFDDVAGWLDAVDGLAVLRPGDGTGTFPAVTMTPGPLRIMPGNRYVRENLTLRVMVPLHPFDTQYRELLLWTSRVLLALSGRPGVGFDAEIPFTVATGEPDDSGSAPAHQAHELTIDYNGRVMWPES